MSGAFEVRIEGLAGAEAVIDELAKPKLTQTMRKATRAAALVYRTAEKAKIREEGLVKTGTLLKSVTMRSMRAAQGVGAIVTPKAHHAHLLEEGHRMVTHKPTQQQIGFVKARPFVAPTFSSAEAEATAAAETVLAAALDL